MNALLDFFNSLYPISSNLQQHLLSVLKSKEVTKKEYLLKKGNICNKIYFIEKGLIRCFYTTDDKEVCSWFMKEGDVIISVESFYNQHPSYENIQALEDCSVYYIDYDELQFIYLNFPEFNYIGRCLTEQYYTLCEQRLYSIRMKSAAERYAFLFDHFPQLIQRVPSMYLASYLGITPETLSRIKSKKLY